MPSSQTLPPWWRGNLPSWMVLGLLSILSFMLIRWFEDMNKRWERMEERLDKFVTVQAFVEYKAAHQDWGNQALIRIENQSAEINRRLVRIEDFISLKNSK